MPVTYKTTLHNLDYTKRKYADAPRKVRTVVDEHLRETNKDLAGYVRGYTPVKRGVIQRSVRAYKVGFMDYATSSSNPITPFVEFPTRWHVIVPKSIGGVLSFVVGGVRVFTRRVVHTGTKGAYMFRRGVDKIFSERNQRNADLRRKVREVLSQ